MIEWLTDFHFLRPWWLAALLPGALLMLWQRLPATEASDWSQIIAPSLLPFLTGLADQEQQRRRTRWLLAAAWSLLCIGLAGPTVAKLPQPLQRDTNGLVVVFDLSPSMRVRDLAPDRLTRARLKTIDFLRERREGMTGLVIYAGDAFTVAPMTPDLNTILHVIPALEPEVMPSPGSHVEAALREALELLINSGHRTGRVLLVTDGMAYEAEQSIDKLMRQFAEYRLDILGAGTAAGGPIPLPDDSFARSSDGRIVVASLPEQRLRNLALRANGRYATLTADERDIEHLLSPYHNPLSDQRVAPTSSEFDLWHDLAHGLALVLLPLIVVLFRRGVIAGLMLLLPLAIHSPPASALSWNELWLTPDQRASRAFAEGRVEEAVSEFRDPAWRGVAAYAAGDYETAEQLFSQAASAAAHYNRGNALAAQGRFADALAAYDEALAQKPGLAAAQHNRQRTEELLQQQQEQSPRKDEPSDSSSPDRQSGQQAESSAENDAGSDADSDDEKTDTQLQTPTRSQADSATTPSANQNHHPGAASPDSSSSPPSLDPELSQDSGLAAFGEESRASGLDMAENSSAGAEENSRERATDPSRQARQDSRDEQMEQQLRRIPEDSGGLLRRQLQREALLRARESRRVHSLPPGAEQDRW